MNKEFDGLETYEEWLQTLPKEDLIHIILGDEKAAPIATTKEPKFSRVQILWAINKLKRKNFEQNEEFVDDIINKIVDMKWNLFYNYDYIRFDVRKPGFWLFTAGLFFSFYGLINLIISLFSWIFR